MGKRRRARELAIQVLFHMEYNPGDPAESFERVCESFGPPKEIRPYSREVVVGVWENRTDLDRLISGSSKNWRVERMSRVDINILRIAIYEVLYMKDVPPKVSIDEAVELGKRYGTEESGAFINGILDHIYNQLKAEGVVDQGG
ncbi:MAG: transcription antitermination factor NusB [Deltaproteobacteria bacterium]|nr:transcription antitermination factor NusB [Deltaproteobacteria bacterium]